MKYRYGIVSTASIVERFVEGIRESGQGEVVAICSRSMQSASVMATRLNIESAYDSSDEMYADPNIDIIYIPTMNAMHVVECKKALLAKKHVIVEKPFGLHAYEVQECFDLARKQGCFLMEAQKSVFLPTTQKVKELIQTGVIGEVQFIDLRAGFPGRFEDNHWMYDAKRGGGSLYGSGTYTIELLQYLFDQPKMEIEGTCINLQKQTDVMCNFQLILNEKILVTSTISMLIPMKNEAVIYGDKGCIVIPNYWKSREVQLEVYGESTQIMNFEFGSEFVFEINHIHECIKNGLIQSPIMPQSNTYETALLVDQLYQKWQLY